MKCASQLLTKQHLKIVFAYLPAIFHSSQMQLLSWMCVCVHVKLCTYICFQSHEIGCERLFKSLILWQISRFQRKNYIVIIANIRKLFWYFVGVTEFTAVARLVQQFRSFFTVFRDKFNSNSLALFSRNSMLPLALYSRSDCGVHIIKSRM